MKRLRDRPRSYQAFDDVEAELGRVLDHLDAAANYADWIVDLMQPDHVAQLAEVGAGTGTITDRLMRRSSELLAVEPSAASFEHLSERFRDSPQVRCVHGDHTAVDQPVDSIVMSNVLEHIEDDVGALRALHHCVRAGGRVAVFSPAFEALYSNFDYRIGHFRRYRRRQLERCFEEAGFVVVTSHYVNAVGAITWWLYARVLGREPVGQTRLLSGWDRFVIPVVRRAERWVRPPFGQSVLVIGERVNQPDS